MITVASGTTARIGPVVTDRHGATSPSLLTRTVSQRSHHRPGSAPAVSPVRTALAVIRRAEPKAQVVTITRWQPHKKQNLDTVMLELREYFARVRSCRYGTMYFLREHAYNCGWDSTQEKHRPIKQTEARRLPLYVGRPSTAMS